MTRKCALCKETNHKNHDYSFFSAPKDPETRKKWQIALAIDNYTVTDDTYVCGKHFHKKDIITHWISGVPPQVIKIKYKKCRLRPGAVPNRNLRSTYHSQSQNKTISNSWDINTNDFLTLKKKQVQDSLEDNETFLIPRKEDNYNGNVTANSHYHLYSKTQDCIYNCEEDYQSDNVDLLEDMDKRNILVYKSELEEPRIEKKEPDQTSEHDNDRNLSVFTKTITEPMDTGGKNDHIPNELFNPDILKTVEYSIKRYDSLEEDEISMKIWKHDIVPVDSYLKEKPIDNNLKTIDDLCVDNRVLSTLNYDLDTQNKRIYTHISDKKMLFEDFLEVCTEVSMPRGWSCVVTSKGHSTTVVYLCMSITKDGLPFVDKQVFLRSNMVLHCVAANREIDPLAYNLVKGDKHIKVRNLLDIEELVDEFNRRIVCQGICDSKDNENDNMIKLAYKDGIKWRHILCPLIINNNSSRCTKCTTLFHTVVHKSQKSQLLNHDSIEFEKEERRVCHRNQSKNI